jgi:phosphatidylglycerol:prolipoprotein diacylglycerol transferase
MPLAIIGGLVGASLLSMLMPDDRQIAGEVLQVDSRIRLFGLVLSGAVVVFIYSRVTRQSFRTFVDVLALPTLGALIVHRFGCFLAGCCWGDVSVVDPWLTSIAATEIGQQVQTWPWLAGEWVRTGVTYAPGSFPYEQQVAVGLIGSDAAQSLPVHPVQLYEASLLGVFLLLFRKTALNKYPAGTIALITMGGYAVIRFVMEFLRADSSLVLGALTATQLQCMALFALALGLIIYFGNRTGQAEIFKLYSGPISNK